MDVVVDGTKYATIRIPGSTDPSNATIIFYNGAASNNYAYGMKTGESYNDLLWAEAVDIDILLPRQPVGGAQLLLTHTSSGSGSSDIAIDNLVVEGGTCGTGLACICTGETPHAEAGDIRNTDKGVISMVETVSAAAPGYADNIELTCAHCLVQSTIGAVYPRWGNSTCPAGHLMYSGYMVGTLSSTGGGGSQYLCLTANMGLAEYRVTAQGTSDVYKVEYMHAADGPLSSLSALDKHDAVCALCQAPDRQWSLMVPGRNDCPSGFVVDYSGHLMAETYNAAGPTQHVCVDDETEGIVDSETDSPSAGLYSVETGDGFGAAGGYIDNKEATCAQCSSDGGPAYVRWGRSSCPEAAKLVYAGLAAGSHYTGHTGGGYNFLCMHSDALYSSEGNTDEERTGARLYRTEYGTFIKGLWTLWYLQDEDVPCAVCQSSGSVATLMQPGNTECPSGWSTEYTGYIMASDLIYHRGEYVCVDSDAEAVATSDSTANTYKAQMLPVEFRQDLNTGAWIDEYSDFGKLSTPGLIILERVV
jgi:hypothetical protein